MEILFVLGIIVWFYFSVLRHSNVRLDATDLSKLFLRAYQRSDNCNPLAHYEIALRAVLAAEFPQDSLIEIVLLIWLLRVPLFLLSES